MNEGPTILLQMD